MRMNWIHAATIAAFCPVIAFSAPKRCSEAHISPVQEKLIRMTTETSHTIASMSRSALLHGFRGWEFQNTLRLASSLFSVTREQLTELTGVDHETAGEWLRELRLPSREDQAVILDFVARRFGETAPRPNDIPVLDLRLVENLRAQILLEMGAVARAVSVQKNISSQDFFVVVSAADRFGFLNSELAVGMSHVQDLATASRWLWRKKVPPSVQERSLLLGRLGDFWTLQGQAIMQTERF